MENHLHLVAASPDLARLIGDFKSFTARKIIDYYKAVRMQFTLDLLAENKPQHRDDRTYQFWQEGSHPQRIETMAVFQQKLEYIHHNPVKRGYVELPEHWRYSSARNYAGLQGIIEISEI